MRVTQNALQLPFFFILSLSPSPQCFWRTGESFINRSDSFLGHTIKYFRKYLSATRYSWRVWHMTRLIYRNQHSQHPKSYKKQPETWKRKTLLAKPNLDTNYFWLILGELTKIGECMTSFSKIHPFFMSTKLISSQMFKKISIYWAYFPVSEFF